MASHYPAHHDIKTGHLTRCQICNSHNLKRFLDLGHQAPCDSLLTAEQLNGPELTYPLRVDWCADCTGVQIDYCVAGEVVYHPNYPYRSGISKPLAEYQRAIASSLISKYSLTSKDLVVDVGSNDGTLLTGFQTANLKCLGVEPTNIADIANQQGVPTIKANFDQQLAAQILAEHGQAKVITMTNVFAHMQTLGQVIAGCYDLLTDDGVIVSETHYLLDILRDTQFDSFYHEHLRTYSLRSLIALFAYYDFTVIDAERGSRYGGNLRVHVQKGSGRSVSSRVNELLELEAANKLDQLATYQDFAKRAQRLRYDFWEFLLSAKRANKTVVGKSAPGRAATLLNYYGLNVDLMPYLAEQSTSLKLGHYVPGTGIPVIDEAQLFLDQPDYVVIYAWHYAAPIMKRLKAAGLKSDFVVPLPELKITPNSEVICD